MSILCYSPPITAIFPQDTDTLLYRGNHLQLIIPAHPLAEDSVQVQSISSGRRFVDWSKEENIESYRLMKKIVGIWAARGVTDYLVIGQENYDERGNFGWEIVPFPKTSNAFSRWMRQLKVIWNVFLGEGGLGTSERLKSVNEYKEALNQETAIAADQLQAVSNDPFCNSQVIEAQTVIDEPEKKVRVLCDYKPLAEQHFLVVTKAHKEKFHELSLLEYLEASEHAQQLAAKYQAPGRIVYLHHKAGRDAGQTVPHWHMHVACSETSNKLFDFAKVVLNLFNMTTTLTPEELKEKVEALRN